MDDWLSSMDQSNAKNTEDVKLWLHLACPTRIAKHKDGICEAGSFDDLDDALYVKSVKPAHSAFGVVSYDEKSDSTLLVRTKISICLVIFLVQNLQVLPLIHHVLTADLSTVYW